jgi:signal transduction histidine kinase
MAAAILGLKGRRPPGVLSDSHRARISILFLYALLAVSVVAIVMKVTVDERQRKLGDAEAHSLNLARALERQVAGLLGSASQYLVSTRDAIENAGGLDAISGARFESLLGAQLTREEAIRPVLMVDARGFLRAASHTSKAADLSDRQWLRDARVDPSRAVTVGLPVRSFVDGRWALPISVRIDKPDGSFGGVIVIGLDIERLARYFKSVEPDPETAIALVRNDGAFLMREPNFESVAGTRVAPANLAQARGTEGSLEAVWTTESTRRISSFRKVADFPLYVAVGVPATRVLAIWEQATAWRIVGGTVAVLLLTLFAVILLQYQARASSIRPGLPEEPHAQSDIEALNARLEQRVRERTDESARVNAELESFSYSISHDLRAPLRHISGYLQIIREDPGSAFSEDASRLMGRLFERVEFMNALIDGLLTLSQVTQKPLQVLEIRLSDMAAQVADELSRAHAARRVEVSIETGLLARGDPTLIHALLENLLGNAWKYSRNAGVARIAFTSGNHEGRTVYMVRDNGAGFDREHARRLFGVFQRLHSVEDFEGIGIGLAICKRIVERHGGRIWAEAEPGKGATFFFTL